MQVDERENERGESKGTQTERSWVCEFAIGDGLVGTRLEFTTKGRKTDRVASVDVGQRVATIVIWLALFGMTSRCSVGVVLVVNAIYRLLSIERLACGRHGARDGDDDEMRM